MRRGLGTHCTTGQEIDWNFGGLSSLQNVRYASGGPWTERSGAGVLVHQSRAVGSRNLGQSGPGFHSRHGFATLSRQTMHFNSAVTRRKTIPCNRKMNDVTTGGGCQFRLAGSGSVRGG